MQNELRACLEQKEVLLTKLLNLSRQIETQLEEPDVPNPLPVIQQRQVYLDRLKKCTSRITAMLDGLPSAKRAHIKSLLSMQRTTDSRSPEEAELAQLEAKCRALLRRINASDSISKSRIKKERDRLQKLVNDSRKKGQKNSLY